MSAFEVLESSVRRLRELARPLDEQSLTMSAFPAEWSIAQVLSHLGSAAVIMQRRLADGLEGRDTPEDYSPSVWDVWNAKTPIEQRDDALAADSELLAHIAGVRPDQRAAFAFAMGPMSFDFDEFIGLRVNEHAMHTWDIAVALDPAATIPPDAAAYVVDHLGLIAQFTAQPTGEARTLVVRTSEPDRAFTLELIRDAVTMTEGAASEGADLLLPAETFARLVYGRSVDADRQRSSANEPVELLQQVFPGA